MSCRTSALPCHAHYQKPQLNIVVHRKRLAVRLTLAIELGDGLTTVTIYREEDHDTSAGAVASPSDVPAASRQLD